MASIKFCEKSLFCFPNLQQIPVPSAIEEKNKYRLLRSTLTRIRFAPLHLQNLNIIIAPYGGFERRLTHVGNTWLRLARLCRTIPRGSRPQRVRRSSLRLACSQYVQLPSYVNIPPALGLQPGSARGSGPHDRPEYCAVGA